MRNYDEPQRVLGSVSQEEAVLAQRRNSRDYPVEKTETMLCLVVVQWQKCSMLEDVHTG